MTQKILVTGAAGFIGFHLTKKLLERGNIVVGIDNLNNYYDVQIKKARLKILQNYSASNGKSFSFERIDLSNALKLNKLFKRENFDKVINLAAQAGVRYSIENPHAYVESNLIGFTNILEACRHNKIKHLTYASTSSVYGANTDLPFKETKEASNPLQFYAATKKANELMAHSYSNLFGLPTSGLRFFTVYGPWGRPDMALFLFTRNIINNVPIKVFNNGEHSRDFTYVDDIVEGVIKVSDIPPEKDPNWNSHDSNSASSSAPYRVLNIGNNNPVKLETFIKEIEKNLQKKAIKEYLPLQDGDVPETYADTSLLHELTGYIPKTTIEDGVRKFIQWYISYHNIK